MNFSEEEARGWQDHDNNSNTCIRVHPSWINIIIPLMTLIMLVVPVTSSPLPQNLSYIPGENKSSIANTRQCKNISSCRAKEKSKWWIDDVIVNKSKSYLDVIKNNNNNYVKYLVCNCVYCLIIGCMFFKYIIFVCVKNCNGVLFIIKICEFIFGFLVVVKIYSCYQIFKYGVFYVNLSLINFSLFYSFILLFHGIFIPRILKMKNKINRWFSESTFFFIFY